MSRQREIIQQGLRELSAASAAGKEAWVTFEANANEHWLQCTPLRINMDWPFAGSPAANENLAVCFGGGRPLPIDGWNQDSYVSFRPAVTEPDALVLGIDSTFQDLYGLGPDYTLSYKLEAP